MFTFFETNNFKVLKAISYQLKSFIPSCKTIEACRYPECYTTTKRTNTGKNQEVILILRGDAVEAYKIKIYSLNIINFALFQCH